MNKVLFIYVPQNYYHPGPRRVDMETPASLPLGLASVKAYAAADPEITNRAVLKGLKFGEDMPAAQVAAAIAAEKPGVAAFSCFILNVAATLDVCRRLRELLPRVKIVVGGAAVPKDAAKLRAFLAKNPAIDAAVFGEGELPFSRWLKAYLDGEKPEVLDGLALRAHRPLIGERTCAPDLANFPSAYVSGAARLLRRNRGSLSIETARGCPFACAYCARDSAGRALRFFGLDRLEKELEWLSANRYEGTVWIVDPIMNFRRDRAAAIFKLLARHKALFMVNIMPELLDDELFRLMRRIPRFGIAIGLQSANPVALRNMGRVPNLERTAANIRELHRKCPKVEYGLQLILGLPGDNYETYKATMDWALGLGRSYNASIMDLVLLENSPLSGMVKKFAIKAAPNGLVTSNCTFTTRDFIKAGWLTVVYHAIVADRALIAAFDEASAREGSHSAVLERLALKAVRAGLLPRRRIVIDSPGPEVRLDAAFLRKELL